MLDAHCPGLTTDVTCARRCALLGIQICLLSEQEAGRQGGGRIAWTAMQWQSWGKRHSVTKGVKGKRIMAKGAQRVGHSPSVKLDWANHGVATLRFARSRTRKASRLLVRLW